MRDELSKVRLAAVIIWRFVFEAAASLALRGDAIERAEDRTNGWQERQQTKRARVLHDFVVAT